MIATCWSFANPAFGDAYLAGAPVVGRAAIGFKVVVTSLEAKVFVTSLLPLLTAGHTIRPAAVAAYNDSFSARPKGSFDAIVSLRGDPNAKLKGVYIGPSNDPSTNWVRVIEEG